MGPGAPTLAACLALAACSFQAADGPARFRCDQGDRCPDGTSCIAGWCERFDAAVTPALPVCSTGDNLRVSFEEGRSAQTDIAWSGDRYGVVWTQEGAPAQVHFTLVENYDVPPAEAVRLSAPADASSWPTVSWSKDLFAAFFAVGGSGSDSAKMAYRAVDEDGEPSGTTPLVLADSDSGAVPVRAQEVAGDLVGVAWQDRVDENDEVYFNRFSTGGAPLGISILVTENVGASWFPSVAWTGSEWGIAWNDDRDGNVEIYFTRLDPDGERLEGDRRVSNAPRASFAPSLIWTGDAYLVTWWDGRADPVEMFLARLVPGDSATEIGPEVRLTPGAYGQVGMLARSGDRIGLTWHAVMGAAEVFAPVFALVDPATGELLTEPLALSDGGVPIDAESLAMTAAGDGSFAVVWADNRSGDTEIYFARVTCE